MNVHVSSKPPDKSSAKVKQTWKELTEEFKTRHVQQIYVNTSNAQLKNAYVMPAGQVAVEQTYYRHVFSRFFRALTLDANDNKTVATDLHRGIQNLAEMVGIQVPIVQYELSAQYDFIMRYPESHPRRLGKATTTPYHQNERLSYTNAATGKTYEVEVESCQSKQTKIFKPSITIPRLLYTEMKNYIKDNMRLGLLPSNLPAYVNMMQGYPNQNATYVEFKNTTLYNSDKKADLRLMTSGDYRGKLRLVNGRKDMPFVLPKPTPGEVRADKNRANNAKQLRPLPPPESFKLAFVALLQCVIKRLMASESVRYYMTPVGDREYKTHRVHHIGMLFTAMKALSGIMPKSIENASEFWKRARNVLSKLMALTESADAANESDRRENLAYFLDMYRRPSATETKPGVVYLNRHSMFSHAHNLTQRFFTSIGAKVLFAK